MGGWRVWVGEWGWGVGGGAEGGGDGGREGGGGGRGVGEDTHAVRCEAQTLKNSCLARRRGSSHSFGLADASSHQFITFS